MTAGDSYFDVAREGLHAGLLTQLRSGFAAVQRCPVCDAAYFPPVLRCGSCGERSLDWTAVADGFVVAAARTSIAPTVVVVDVGGCRVPAIAHGEVPLVGSRVGLGPALATDGEPTGGFAVEDPT